MKSARSILTRLSVTAYRALLAAYPRSFRRVYAREMTIVFRDRCNAATREEGVWGLARLWPATLYDLSASALAERVKEATMTAQTLLRRSSAACALAGSGLWLIVSAWGVYIATQPSNPMNNWRIDDVPFPLTLNPAAWIFFAVALFGALSQLRGSRRAVLLGWLGGLIAVVGMLMEFVGAGGLAWGRSLSLWTDGDCLSDPFACQAMGFLQPLTWHGILLIGLGMLLLGAIALRASAFGRWNRLPLAMGAFFFALFPFTDDIAPSILRNTVPGEISIAVAYPLTYAVWSVGWVLLAFELWSRPYASTGPAPQVTPAL
jgi:hypothetical protein